jgi:Fe-S-cluster containining protein|tara:strand:+ start:128 stop:472 length:345 start_codon:yes stop_codon:yes gene_type:complete
MKANDLCLDCGLCCNGTLSPGVYVEESKHHLFKNILKENKKILAYFEPNGCEQLDNCNLCKIYENRPSKCKEYECGVLGEVKTNNISFAYAELLIKDLKNNPQDETLLKRFKNC